MPRLTANLLSNYLHALVSVCATLVVVPILFRGLGGAEYGLLAVALAVAAVMESLDLGLHSASMRLLASHGMVETRRTEFQEVISTSFFLLLLTGAATAALVTLGFRIFSHWAAGILVVAMVFATVPFQMGTSILRAVLEAKRHFPAANLVDILFQIGRAAFIIFELRAGNGLFGIAAAYLLSAAARMVVMGTALHFVSRDLRPALRHFRVASLQGVVKFARQAFLHESSSRLAAELDMIVSSAVLPLQSVGVLAVCRKLPLMVPRFAQIATWVGYPGLCSAGARQDQALLQRAYCAGTLILLVVAGSPVLFLALWADVLMPLWIRGIDQQGLMLIKLYLLAALFMALREIPIAVLYAVGKIFPSSLIQGGICLGVLAAAAAALHGGLLAFGFVFALVQCLATVVLLLFSSRAIAVSGETLLEQVKEYGYILAVGIAQPLACRFLLPSNLASAVFSAAFLAGVLLFVVKVVSVREAPVLQQLA